MSSFQLEIIDPLQYPQWDELLLSQPKYSFFHSASWARVLSESYRYRPLYFAQIDRGRVSVLVPLMEVKSAITGCRGVGLPFTDYCEPVISKKERCGDVMDQVVAFGKKARWDSIEIRPGNGSIRGFPTFSSFFVHTLDLTPGADALFKNFRDNTRRNIKKSVKEGVTATFHTSPESIAAFYRLNCSTRKDHGLPPQPYVFFKKIYEHVISRHLGFVALASYRGREIAGAVYFNSREEVIYKYGASLRSSQHLRPNNLLMWKVIQRSSENGYKSLCFGRTDLNHTGLRQFKSGWGGDERTIDYYKYDLKKGAFVKSTSMSRSLAAVWKHIPLPFLKFAGRILYRHVG